MKLLAALLLAGASLSAAAAGAILSAPLFAATLFDLDNKPVAFADYKGKPLIVNFWARWCAPCRVEIPELVDLQIRHKVRGIEVIGVNLESDAPPVRDFAKAYDINYPVLLTRDKGIALLQALGNGKAGLPYTVVINRKGEVVASKLGAMNRAELEVATEAALK
ncbi:MAG: thioredoxin [Rhodocyclaceae bacterium]|nr:MAG: thioredoxin [Rhodocyclaceae bacterium]TND02061.1 MAG: thioredoxin [Rhodocyclaceae bacterium]